MLEEEEKLGGLSTFLSLLDRRWRGSGPDLLAVPKR